MTGKYFYVLFYGTFNADSWSCFKKGFLMVKAGLIIDYELFSASNESLRQADDDTVGVFAL